MLGPQPNPKFLVSFIVFVAIFTRRILFCSSKCTLSCILTRSWLMCCNFCISCCILALGPRNRPHFHLRRNRHYREVVPVFVLPVSSSFTFGSFGKGLVSLISSFFRAWYWANNRILWGIIILVLFFLVNYDGKIKKKGFISSWARPTKNNQIEIWRFFSSTQSPNIIRGMNGLRSFTKFLLWGNRHFFYFYLSSPMIFLPLSLPLLYFANCFLSILSSCQLILTWLTPWVRSVWCASSSVDSDLDPILYFLSLDFPREALFCLLHWPIPLGNWHGQPMWNTKFLSFPKILRDF